MHLPKCKVCRKRFRRSGLKGRGRTALTCSHACYHANRMNLQRKRRLTRKHLFDKLTPDLNLRDSSSSKGRKAQKKASVQKRKLAFELAET
jgi:hypothetical protein